MHIAIRADGGPDIGYGHLVRSNTLAEGFLADGNTVTIATTTQSVQEVFSDAIHIVELSSRGNPKPFVEWLKTKTPDAVFKDAYPVDTAYQQAIRKRVPLAVLQDDARHAVCADLFTNGNLYAPDLDYEYVGEKPTTCLGTNYILLRSEIRNRAGDAPPWRQEPERALVTMGGSDMRNLTPIIIEAFDGFDLRVDAIVGPGFSEKQERDIRTVAADVSTDVHVARDPDDLPERMFRADFAVSTASSTVYELLALGTPVVCQPIADNQDLIAVALERRNAATVLNRDAGEEAFRRAIEKYVDDPTLRRERRELGCELVDGNGTKRVCSEILSLVDQNNEV